ncbi:hypothetical protein O3M35_012671 [Rhynocoris fuscipes]|uniref:Dynein assembly factor 3, axonemal n=1 Tax=Rhynocoris fuscipes TaxID=488301 RepID=A0AAW1CYW3_9HEMI
MFWGYSPALDLLNEYKLLNTIEGKTELNILVAGSADARHVLMTLAKYYKHEDAKNLTINFYIVDLLLEFLARELLLLLIALEPSAVIGLKEKADLWMEVYGNSMLRSATAEYIAEKSYQYIRMVTNKNYLCKRMPCLDLDYLKYKEKDRLEIIFKFWMNNKLDMAESWDRRVRKYLGTRYDSKAGLFDWDYYFNIKEMKNGELVNAREYKHWRSTGVAFTWPEKEYSVSNGTLAVGIEQDGDRIGCLEYLGDILSGPYYSFGLECDDKEMLKTINSEHAKRATDITERNLMRIFYEIENNEMYKAVGEVRDLGVIVTEMQKFSVNDPKLNVEFNQKEDVYTAIPIKHRLIFLPTNSLDDAAKILKFQNFFDLMIFGQGLIKKLNNEVLNMSKDKGVIIMESRKFLLLKDDSLETYIKDVIKVMNEANCKLIGKVKAKENDFLKFQMNVNEEIVDNDMMMEEEKGNSFEENDEMKEDWNEFSEENENSTNTVEENQIEDGKVINSFEDKEVIEESTEAANQILENANITEENEMREMKTDEDILEKMES